MKSYHKTMTCEELIAEIIRLELEQDTIRDELLSMREDYEIVAEYVKTAMRIDVINHQIDNLARYLPE